MPPVSVRRMCSERLRPGCGTPVHIVSCRKVTQLWRQHGRQTVDKMTIGEGAVHLRDLHHLLAHAGHCFFQPQVFLGECLTLLLQPNKGAECHC